MNTDTPEIDAHVLETLNNGMRSDILGRFNLLLPFARKLERQRNKAIDECIALRQMVRELRDATEAVLPYIEGDKIAPWRPARNAITKANQLLP